MDAEHDLDFSARTAPEAWHAAQADAPASGEATVAQARAMALLPDRRSIDPLLTFLSSTATSVIAGYTWYALHEAGIVSGPWPAVALGIVMAVGVRIGAGPRDPQARMGIAVMVYVVTLAVVTFFTARHTFLDLYGGSSALMDLEHYVVVTALTDPATIAAWLGGAVAAAKVSLLIGHRR